MFTIYKCGYCFFNAFPNKLSNTQSSFRTSHLNACGVLTLQYGKRVQRVLYCSLEGMVVALPSSVCLSHSDLAFTDS